MPSTLPDELADLIAFWKVVERRIKLTEQVRHVVVFGPINELRYAGECVVEIVELLYSAESSSKADDIKKKIAKAMDHLSIADKDCADAACVYLHDKVEHCRAKYGTHVISGFFTDFLEFVRKIEAVNKIITDSRADRRANYLTYYSDIHDIHIPQMIALNERLTHAERHVLEKSRRERHLVHFGTFVAFLAILITVIVEWHAIVEFWERVWPKH